MDGLILLSMPLLDVYSDIRLALALVFFVYILNWAKAAVGSPKIAVLLGAVLAYLTIYRHPDLVWVFFVIFLAGTGVLGAFIGKAK
ncbi:MAG TPA: hypothetical protein VJA40_04235 [archaeon]|nr:hypothetical protein [archaeon]